MKRGYVGIKIDKAKRRAAGHSCMTLFAVQGAVTHGLTILLRDQYEGLGEGLTPKEKEYVSNLQHQSHELGERFRKLGWRFHGR